MSQCHKMFFKLKFTFHSALFMFSMLCRFVLLTLLHGWPNPVGDDIHFLPTKELLTNYPNLLYIAQRRSQNSGASACFLPFRCVFSVCLFIETTMARQGSQDVAHCLRQMLTVSSNSVCSFEATKCL